MALPDPRGTHADFLSGIVYFKCSLAADPSTADLAPSADAILARVRSAHQAVELGLEAELAARAVRNYLNRKGDPPIQAFRAELSGIAGSKSETLKDVFPRGIRYVIDPSGEEQAARLRELIHDIDQARQGLELGSHPRKEKVLHVLEEGRAGAAAYLQALEPAVAAWASALDALELARKAEQQAMDEGHAAATSILGELKKRFGSEAAAQGYTLQEKSPRAPKEAPAPEGNA